VVLTAQDGERSVFMCAVSKGRNQIVNLLLTEYMEFIGHELPPSNDVEVADALDLVLARIDGTLLTRLIKLSLALINTHSDYSRGHADILASLLLVSRWDVNKSVRHLRYHFEESPPNSAIIESLRSLLPYVDRGTIVWSIKRVAMHGNIQCLDTLLGTFALYFLNFITCFFFTYLLTYLLLH